MREERLETLRTMLNQINDELERVRKERVREALLKGTDPAELYEDDAMHELRKESAAIYTAIETLERIAEGVKL